MLCGVLALSASGCFNWENALSEYQRLTAPDAAVEVYSGTPEPDGGTPNGSKCERDWECTSRQCLAGTCQAGGTTASGGGACADLNDCASPYVCEARLSSAYVCTLNTACLLESRLCTQDPDCCPGGLCDAPNNCVARKCVSGVCRQSPVQCKAAGAACTRPEECCSGTGCGPAGDGGMACAAADAGQYPDGFMCSSTDQCTSTKCGGTPVRCQPLSVTGNGLGQACGGGCYSAIGNSYECNSNKCCISTGKLCVSNAGCCSGQCLDGYCASQGACRTAGLGCRENGDCCSGNCTNGACVPTCAAPTESCATLPCCWGKCGAGNLCEYP